MLDIYSSGRGSQLSLETLCLLCLSSVLVTSEKCDSLDRYGCQTLGKEKRPWVVPCNHMSLILYQFQKGVGEGYSLPLTLAMMPSIELLALSWVLKMGICLTHGRKIRVPPNLPEHLSMTSSTPGISYCIRLLSMRTLTSRFCCLFVR